MVEIEGPVMELGSLFPNLDSRSSLGIRMEAQSEMRNSRLNFKSCRNGHRQWVQPYAIYHVLNGRKRESEG